MRLKSTCSWHRIVAISILHVPKLLHAHKESLARWSTALPGESWRWTTTPAGCINPCSQGAHRRLICTVMHTRIYPSRPRIGRQPVAKHAASNRQELELESVVMQHWELPPRREHRTLVNRAVVRLSNADRLVVRDLPENSLGRKGRISAGALKLKSSTCRRGKKSI